MKISVLGAGYVGLVYSAVLAEVGHNLVCVDIDEKKIAALNEGILPLFEPGLTELVQQNLHIRRLTFSTEYSKALEHGDVLMLCVGTPCNTDGSASLDQVFNAVDQILHSLKKEVVIVNKSTVPVGTADRLEKYISEKLTGKTAGKIHVCANPEFLKEGTAVADCMKPDRVVVGCAHQSVRRVMQNLYAPFNRNHHRMLFMDTRSAELTKYAANAMLALKISFINEIAGIAEKLGADIENIRQGIGSDSRIGYQFIYPGCGYGGSCFPKDVRALQVAAQKQDYDPLILRAVIQRNIRQRDVLFNMVSDFFKGNLKGKQIALWGLSYKPNTSDMREAPSCYLMEALWSAGCSISAYDPQAMEECERMYGVRDDLHLSGTSMLALRGADALIICTEWKQFWAPDFTQVGQLLKSKVIFDGRNVFCPEQMAQLGFVYFSIGRSRYPVGAGTLIQDTGNNSVNSRLNELHCSTDN